MDQPEANDLASALPRTRFWRFVARRGWQLFAVVLLFWAIDLTLSGWRGWGPFAVVLAVALLVGPVAAAVAYATRARSRSVRACLAGLFGVGLGFLLRGAIAPNWPVWGQIACIVGVAVGMAIVELSPPQDEGAGTPASAP